MNPDTPLTPEDHLAMLYAIQFRLNGADEDLALSMGRSYAAIAVRQNRVEVERVHLIEILGPELQRRHANRDAQVARDAQPEALPESCPQPLSPAIELEMLTAIKNLLDGMDRPKALEFARLAVCRFLDTGGVEAELDWLRQIITPELIAQLRDQLVRQSDDDPCQILLGEYDYDAVDAGHDDAFAWDSCPDD